MLKINIQNAPSQTFELVIENKTIEFRIVYNSRGDFFTQDIFVEDEDGNTTEINGIKLVSGIPLYAQFNLFDGDFYVVNSAEFMGDPVQGSWGIDTELFYFDPNDVAQLNG